jgi:pimeloyl-ACP methyl ester carboxylesterase
MHGLQTNKKTSGDLDIVSNGIRIHAREESSGEPTLVFLHYWGGSVRTWAGVIDELSKEYRAIAMDHRGWGDSEAPPTEYGISDLADDAGSGKISSSQHNSWVVLSTTKELKP